MSITVPAGEAWPIMLAAGACHPASVEVQLPDGTWKQVTSLRSGQQFVAPGEATYRASCPGVKECDKATLTDLVCVTTKGAGGAFGGEDPEAIKACLEQIAAQLSCGDPPPPTGGTILECLEFIKAALDPSTC